VTDTDTDAAPRGGPGGRPPGAALSPAKQALLAQRLRRGAGAAPRRTIPSLPAGQPPPPSRVQEGMWFLEQLTPGTTRWTIPLALRLRGTLDVTALRAALDAMLASHDALRMRYRPTGDGRPQVVVTQDATLPLTVAEAPDEAAARTAVDEFLAVPFDLAAGPVARALLIRLGPSDHVLAFGLHHIAGDGWSLDLLVREVFARLAGRTPQLPEVGYGDYAAWQRGLPPRQDDLDFWRERVAGLEPLDLPADRPRPAERTHAGAACGFSLGQQPATTLGRLGRERGATPFMVMLAGLAALLGRYAGTDDVAVGSPTAGRPEPELDAVIGSFATMLTMRVDLSGDPTFAELLDRVRDIALDAFAHQGLSIEELIPQLNLPRDLSRSPLFDVTLTMQNYRTGAIDPPAGLTVTLFPLYSWSARYDLEAFVADDSGGGLSGWFVYNTDLFEQATIERLAGHLHALLEQVAARPGLRLSEIDLLGADERRLVTETWNGTATRYPGPATLHGRIEAQAARTPAAVALRFDGRELTYAELDAAANRVARTLRGHGVGTGSVVAVCAERSAELLPGLLGVLKAGAAYLPIDPDYPADRVEFMLADAAPAVLLTQRKVRPARPASGVIALDLDDPGAWPDGPGDDSPPRPAVHPDDIAYIIYTSGSTGRPKGVPNTHRGIANRLDWMQQRYQLRPDDVVAQKTPVSFDVSVWELFWPLREGARLVLATPGGHKDAGYLRQLIIGEGVTTVHFVPSMLAAFCADDGAADCRTLTRVICSGEELPADLARRCTRILPGAGLHNLYGPTEAAVDVSAWHCAPERIAATERVPIGAPIANTALYVLDKSGGPTPIGVPGELFIGGAGLARGYLNRPALTGERFVPSPFGPPGARLYRTGDLARWRDDGTLEFLGRIDGQVKLRGMRIEPGEIEAALRALPAVRDAAVIVREDRPGDKRLVAYLVPADTVPAGTVPAGTVLDHAAVRAELKKTLPDLIVPAGYVTLATLPLSPNGKLDRRALPPPTAARDAAVELIAPSTPTEQALAAIWSDLLGTAAIGIGDDFFALGGHSLLATQVVARLRSQAGVQVSVMDVFKHPTIGELAALADTPAERRGPRELLHRLTPARGPAGSTAPALSYVCVPYGGGSAVVYQPLADALPADCALWSVSIPGHDVGLDEDALAFDELAAACVTEILGKVHGPVAVYGHCGVGTALCVEIARRLEAAGGDLAAVYLGGMFPFARPQGRLITRATKVVAAERLRSNQQWTNWLISMGVDMSEVDPAQARRIVRNMRRDSIEAEAYYTRLLTTGAGRLRAPVISVVGASDPATDFYQERYREWHFMTSATAVVVLAEAGHFFLKYRAPELAEIVTATHRALAEDTTAALSEQARGPGATWWLHGASRSDGPVAPPGAQPSFRRFFPVAASQLVSAVGSAMTEFAVPLWIYTTTGSVAKFALMAVVGLVPGLLVLPVAGALVDRASRRAVMLAGDTAAFCVQLVFGILLWTGHLGVAGIYPLLACLSVALTFQRIAYISAVPQLVPKHSLGHAVGLVQLGSGTGQLLVPIFAVGLLAGIGLGGIVALDIGSYAVAIVTLALVRFPATMAWRRRESLLAEITGGLRYSLGHRGFVGMLAFFVVLNIFLAPLMLMFGPLVLSFAHLADVGRISLLGGVGVVAAALAMMAWGGPRRLRLRGVLLCTVAVGCFSTVIGLRANLVVIALGVFGMIGWTTLLNGIYTTIVQVKVPQRFHGRVFAIQTLIAWSTMPLGFGLVAPNAAGLLNPLLASGGALASTAGRLIGTGPGRGIGFMYVVFGLAIVAIALIAMRVPVLARFDRDVPDAVADDLVGVQALRAAAVSPDPPSPGKRRQPPSPAHPSPAAPPQKTEATT
jgi:amino acid adenylation domain-containing protein